MTSNEIAQMVRSEPYHTNLNRNVIADFIGQQATKIAELEKQLDIRTRELIGASFYEHDYKTMMANNEPVAWMSEFGQFIGKVQDEICHIPLYTHPVKEQDTDCQYCKQGCIRCDARKQLTDEEIINLINKHIDYVPDGDGMKVVGVMEFARAILRKAQEK